MRLNNIRFLTATVLAASVICSEALRSSNDDQPTLHPILEASGLSKPWPQSPEVTAFIQNAVQAEITEQLHTYLVDHLRANSKGDDNGDEKAAPSLVKKLLDGLKPALQSIFSSTTKSLKPIISDECKRVISVVQGHAPEEGSEDEDESTEIEDGASFVTMMQANEGFWDTLKDTVKKGIGKIASPALAAIAEKLSPAFQKLGERAVPLFREQVKKLIRLACAEAEEEAGVL